MMRIATRRMVLGLVAGAGLLAEPAEAGLVTYFGTDTGATSADPRPYADAAAASFDAAAGALGPLTLIDFEAAPLGGFTSLAIAPGVTASSAGNTSIRDTPASSPDSVHGYNTTVGGGRFLYSDATLGSQVVLSFSDPIQAFGAYFTGVQLAGQTITYFDGTVDQVVPIPGPPAGGVSFVGFTDAGRSIASITLNFRLPTLSDAVGLDDLRFVPTAAVAPVPEPSTLALAGTGALFGLVASRRRRRLDRRAIVS